MEDISLLETVVEFKNRFYPCGGANYDLAKPGTLRLVPPDHVLKAVKSDYREMRTMIFGEYPAIEEIMAQLQELE
ncbi:MAG: hypothetical protein J0665_08255 [Deltaproteobacteria bacterium]|nr:hypothetical protein [Deltaproteobacteria bacterium]